MAAPRGQLGARQPPGRGRKVAERRHRRAPKFPARAPPRGSRSPARRAPADPPPGLAPRPGREPAAEAGGALVRTSEGEVASTRWRSVYRGRRNRLLRAGEVDEPGLPGPRAAGWPRAPTGHSGVRDRFDFCS